MRASIQDVWANVCTRGRSQLVCEALERHLPVVAGQRAFFAVLWRDVRHVLALAWDRYAESAFEAAWQVRPGLRGARVARTSWY